VVNNAVQLRALDLRSATTRVELQLESVLPGVRGDGNQLMQVFFNIISNALDAMEAAKGGVLTSKPSVTAPTWWSCFPTAVLESRSRIASLILSIRRSPSAKARAWDSASASASSRNTPERFFVTTARKAAQFSAWNCPLF